MTHPVQTYWEWDEKFNDTPYKLGADINDLLQQGLVKASIDHPRIFLGSAKGAPEHVEVWNGEVRFIFFSSLIYLPIYYQRIVEQEAGCLHYNVGVIFKKGAHYVL